MLYMLRHLKRILYLWTLIMIQRSYKVVELGKSSTNIGEMMSSLVTHCTHKSSHINAGYCLTRHKDFNLLNMGKDLN